MLHVASLSGGSYEIYRIASESPLQLISEEMGFYNKPMALDPGTYLILADCSSETVVIHPYGNKQLIAHSLNFASPTTVNNDDLFLIQCSRHGNSQTRQRIINRFSLNVLAGKRDLLVGMVPLSIDFSTSEYLSQPTQNDFNLGSIEVADYAEKKESIRYFVSPLKDILAVTESQELGKKIFLLPGNYVIELNGSKTEITLMGAENLQINPAFLKVSTQPNVDLASAPSIKGSPLYVEINGAHWLNLNDVYPMMPGKSFLRLDGNESQHGIDLESGVVMEKHARSVVVDLDCPPWDWHCLGSKKVFLFQKDQTYPFALGSTDTPILYFEEEVLLSLEGSRGLFYHLPLKQEAVFLETGMLILKPRFEAKPGLITDLVRIEAVGLPFSGDTLDLPLDQNSQLPLIAGNYQLVQYNSSTNVDGERRKITTNVSIKAKTTKEIIFTVFLSEKKYKQYKDAKLAKLKTPVTKISGRSALRYQAPLRFFTR